MVEFNVQGINRFRQHLDRALKELQMEDAKCCVVTNPSDSGRTSSARTEISMEAGMDQGAPAILIAHDMPPSSTTQVLDKTETKRDNQCLRVASALRKVFPCTIFQSH